jgi:hypothetical protein
VLLTTIDTDEAFYDSTPPRRERAMDGVFLSGRLVKDARSDNRRALEEIEFDSTPSAAIRGRCLIRYDGPIGALSSVG